MGMGGWGVAGRRGSVLSEEMLFETFPPILSNVNEKK